MKTAPSAVLAALALVLTVAAAGPVAAAENHTHPAHPRDDAPRLQLDDGKKWATDAPLRQGMATLNQAMAEALPRIHKNHFTPADYEALAKTVDAQVAFMVANCKLEPRADAMLHQVIAELLAGAGTMQSETGQPRHDGAQRVLRALQDYGEYFQHPGWKPVRG